MESTHDPAQETRRAALRSFLRSRRDRLTPAVVGLPESGTRRARGLRREDVAEIAGVSLGWYARFELGHLTRVSERTIEAIAGALALDEAERTYLHALARPIRAQAEPARERVPDGLRFVVESYAAGPAAIFGPRLDMLVANDIARRVSPGFEGEGLRNNLAWLAFVDPAFSDTFDDREKRRRDIAAMLRYACAQHVGEREYDELIESISERSADFARAWNAFEVKPIGSEDISLRIDGEVATFSTVVLSASEAPTLTVMFLKPNDPERFLELIARRPATG